FNPTPSGGETRGDDCDDMDGAVYSGAPERCNAIDDDCDTLRDEDFDCVQSTPAIGTNACGHEGMRRCSDACASLDPAFYVAESAATCDYCDDSGMGLGQELPFTITRSVIPTSSMLRAEGDATTCADPVFCSQSRILQRAMSNDAGAIVFAEPIVLGHGPLELYARVRVTAGTADPGMGWSLSAIRADDGGAALVGVGADAGIPARRDLLAAVHRFPGTDAIQLSRVTRAGSAPSVITSATGPAFGVDGPVDATRETWLRLSITPDDPSTPADETAATASYPTACPPPPIPCGLECGGTSGRACGVRFQRGERVTVAVTAGSTALRSEVLILELRSDAYAVCTP
ncbi:MAG: putative metal-binding motif-containing protein, partial [Sandaracinaceae bacterium]|nr:putative metal-binding motif-containing protein [Sandaracinaceae bacterium]